MIKDAAQVIDRVRQNVPLIQAVTNYVTINDCANILLAFGASPAMVEAREEAGDFAQYAHAVYINLGTLTNEQEEACVRAAAGAKKAGKPVVLDPAGCGAVPRKADVIAKIAALGRIDILKGNTGEIMVLAGLDAKVRGVDSMENEAGAEEAAGLLAKKYGCTVAATGEVDVVTDGSRFVHVHNGVELLTKITGAGCMAGALCAATAAVCEDMTVAACAAMTAMGIAGERAYQKASLPGSFRVALMDAIYTVTGDTLKEMGEWA
jgi:hydroxyethylthiazole kinase